MPLAVDRLAALNNSGTIFNKCTLTPFFSSYERIRFADTNSLHLHRHQRKYVPGTTGN
jgi:hypothetical protein